MMFAENAGQLCGQCALALGWRPDDFWSATPAELQSVLAVLSPQNEAPPDASLLARLMAQFPDTSACGPPWAVKDHDNG
ncbi:MAG: phage tail assembly chaperone [Sphingorhabdus sp.]